MNVQQKATGGGFQVQIAKLVQEFTRDLLKTVGAQGTPRPRGLAALPFEERQVVARKAAATRKRRRAARKAADTRARNKTATK
jgi:hypothetical protein